MTTKKTLRMLALDHLAGGKFTCPHCRRRFHKRERWVCVEETPGGEVLTAYCRGCRFVARVLWALEPWGQAQAKRPPWPGNDPL
jgi:hypothetical protein